MACSGVSKADHIATLQLSSHSSDATPVERLLATFTFSVSMAGDHLTLRVANDTVAIGDPGGRGLGAYDINQIYFNGPGGKIGLTLVSGNGWGFSTNESADGFGFFGFAMQDVGGSPNAISSGGYLEFEFTITGGTATAADFVDNFSTVPPGDLPSLIAAKFIRGPASPDSPDGDDSAYGALVPLPPALPMGIAGLIGVAFLRRRTLKK